MSDPMRTADDAAKGLMPECTADDFGKETRLGYDSQGYERRDLVSAVTECPKCLKPVALVEMTEAWTDGEGGKWDHSGYGPGMGVCCGILFADGFEGLECFELANAAARIE